MAWFPRAPAAPSELRIAFRMSVAVFLALASGCAALRPPAQPTRYACDDGKAFAVQYRSTNDAVIDVAGMRFRLQREPSGSGARYACNELTLLTQGDRASVEMDGRIAFRNCRALER